MAVRPTRALRNAAGTVRKAVLAAGTRIRISEPQDVRRTLALREDWQDLAWMYFDQIGELKYGVYFLGDALSKLRLYPAVRDPEDPTAEPEQDTSAEARGALARLRSPIGGHSEILRECGIHLSVPGECYLVGLASRSETETERWFIASRKELESKDGQVTVKDPETGNPVVLRGDDNLPTGAEPDFWARIWRRHPVASHKADSAVRAILEACEELAIIGRYFRSVARSRISMSQILFVPNDLSFGNTDPTTDDAGDGEESEDPFVRDLLAAFTTPIQDEGDASAVAPIIIRGDRAKDGGDSGIEAIPIERTADELMAKRADYALRRIAQGLNLSPERIFGLGQANHWGAGQIEESDFQQHIEPLAILVVDALTSAYYQPALRAAGVTDVERRILWFDASALVVDKERKSKALDALKEGLISEATARAEMGYTEDDAPDEAERQRRLTENRGMLVGDVTEELLRRTLFPGLAVPHLTPTGEVVDTPSGERRGTPSGERRGTPSEQPDGAEEAAAEDAVTAGAAGRTNLGDQLIAIDRDLRARLDTLFDTTLRRALEAAGNKLRSKARRDAATTAAIANVPAHQVAATLGPNVVAALTTDEADLVASVIDAITSQFDRLVARAQTDALNLIPNLQPEAAATARQQQIEDRLDAWAWTRDALVDLAARRLYDPAPDAPDEPGEFNADSLIPSTLVREACARAGGAHRAGAVTAGLLNTIGTFLKRLGVATGFLMGDLLTAHNVMIDGYRWEYGPFPRTRPFEPHRELDGVEFLTFEDPRLMNTFGFPADPYFIPGDHDGCVCDAVPILIEVSADEAVELEQEVV